MKSHGVKPIRVSSRHIVFLILLSLSNAVVLIPAASAGSHVPMQASDTTWELLESDYPGGIFWDVSFFNSTHGWIVGSENDTFASDLIVLHTNDSGESWQLLFTAGFGSGADLEVVDEQTIWITGSDRNLFYTVDGGANWNESKVFGAIGGMSTVKFVNKTHGWTGNNDVLYRTRNGGLTWEAVPGWTFSDRPRMIQVLTSLNIWAAGYSGIYHSLDGGETWVRTSTRGGWALSFVSDIEGWVIGDDRLAKTVDGQTWTELTVPMRYPAFRFMAPYTTDIQFVDESNGWIVGDEIKVMYTPNGGDVWYEQSVPASATGRFTAVEFINETHGWAVGYGRIIRTRNGNDLGSRLWKGMTDPYFMSIVAVAAVISIISFCGIRLRRRRRSKPASVSIGIQ